MTAESGVLHIQPLDPTRHDRPGFDCGVAELNDYLAKQANQDVKRSAAGCWVAVASKISTKILGFYTLSPEAIDAVDLPELPKSLGRKMPRYRRIGAALLGRLAVSKDAQGIGLGEKLLYDVLTRCRASEIPFVVVLVDPKDETAADWYARFGFRRLNVNRMVVTILELSAYFDSPG